MRLESQNLRPVSATLPTSQTRATTRAAGVASREDVQLSGAGNLLLAAQQTLSGVPDVRAAKVSQFQGQLASGRYQVQADRVAEALLAE